MPLNREGTLTPDEVYALTAYLLFINGVIPEDQVLDQQNLAQVKMPLGDNYASQFHARIFNKDGQWFVEDLGSTNGTYVNQRRITAPAEVRAGDRVRIGKTTLELRR